MSRFLREAAEQAANGEPVSGLGRELEKLAIDSMAITSLARIRARAASSGLNKMSPRQITAVIKATRRARRA
jgi:phage shock protein A